MMDREALAYHRHMRKLSREGKGDTVQEQEANPHRLREK